MTTIRVKDNEPFEVALRRFKRTIEKLGLLTDLRAREFYEKPTSERKRKKAAAVKRNYKRIRSMQLPKKTVLNLRAVRSQMDRPKPNPLEQAPAGFLFAHPTSIDHGPQSANH